MRTSLLLCAALFLVSGGFSCNAAADQEMAASTLDRPKLDLSGEWEFRTDPLDSGRAEQFFKDSAVYERKITVPGSWNAQGVAFPSEAALREYEKKTSEEHKHLYGLGTLGKESESAKLFSAYPGPAWYRKRVTIPASWKGKVPWLIFGGIHRSAEVWVNGEPAGSHHSYLIPFRIDLSGRAKAGDSVTIVARVDARRARETDPLMGCLDTLDFLYISWGGLYRSVYLEATEPARLGDIFVVPHVATATAEIRAQIEGPAHAGFQIEVEVLAADGGKVASAKTAVEPGARDPIIQAAILNPSLWSPTSPYLYSARVRLLEDNRTIDTRTIRFGMREFQVAQGKFLLNGQAIFLRGYGDDAIFPNTICPPANKELLSRRLAAARAYGFNYVRHHSWIPPEEYLDAADELGMMLQPEFPFAYRWDLPTSAEAKRSALEQWQAMIRLHRNHPSIVTWCMGNELYDSFDLAPEMYQLARQLDPSRPVIDSDGCGFKHEQRGTLDFMVVQFGEGSSIGFEDGKYHFGAEVRKPVLAHEMGYFVTLHDLSQLDLFQGGLRPYWLTQARDLARSKGVLAEYPAWLAASYQLQAACFKSNMEAARRSRLSGTSVWLFQDYPNCAEGVVDMFFRPKGLTAEEFRVFNSPTVLLLETARRNWRAGEKTAFKLLTSRFEEPATTAKLNWTLTLNNHTVASGEQDKIQVGNQGITELCSAELPAPSLAQAGKLTLHAHLADANGHASNSWSVWVFPANLLADAGARVQFHEFAPGRALYPTAQEWSPNASRTEGPLLVAARLSPEVTSFLIAGGRVFLVDPEPAFAIEKTNFRLSSWDGGGPSGTILDPAHPAFSGMPNDGWCDLQFYHLIQGSKTVFLDGYPEKIRPLVRCIDRPTRLANRAYLFEASVGRGRLLVSGFNFQKGLSLRDPASIFFFDQLVQYALGPKFNPQASLSTDSFKSKAKE